LFCHDFAGIGNIFTKGIKFLEEGLAESNLLKMGFGRNGAVVSLWWWKQIVCVFSQF
jgi:hypothetical protein